MSPIDITRTYAPPISPIEYELKEVSMLIIHWLDPTRFKWIRIVTGKYQLRHSASVAFRKIMRKKQLRQKTYEKNGRLQLIPDHSQVPSPSARSTWLGIQRIEALKQVDVVDGEILIGSGLSIRWSLLTYYFPPSHCACTNMKWMQKYRVNDFRILIM